MRFSAGLLALVPLVMTVVASPMPEPAPAAGAESALSKRAVSQAVFDDLKFYMQYASTAYGWTALCTRPNGNTLVDTFSSIIYDTQGYITRDDNRKEIVVTFRGSSSLTDFLTDGTIYQQLFISSGVDAPFGTRVHAGFSNAYNSVALEVIRKVRAALVSYPTYTIVTSGHSLGGALSTLGGISLKQNFPAQAVRTYTYGAPRVGNDVFANWVNAQIGVDNLFRFIHTNDGVPTMLPTYLGYEHHATEYWQNPDPATAASVKKCSGNEDSTCSKSKLSGGINAAHLTYFGTSASTTFCT